MRQRPPVCFAQWLHGRFQKYPGISCTNPKILPALRLHTGRKASFWQGLRGFGNRAALSPGGKGEAPMKREHGKPHWWAWVLVLALVLFPAGRLQGQKNQELAELQLYGD